MQNLALPTSHFVSCFPVTPEKQMNSEKLLKLMTKIIKHFRAPQVQILTEGNYPALHPALEDLGNVWLNVG